MFECTKKRHHNQQYIQSLSPCQCPFVLMCFYYFSNPGEGRLSRVGLCLIGITWYMLDLWIRNAMYSIKPLYLIHLQWPCLQAACLLSVEPSKLLMTRAKKIVQTGVQDYLTQIFALILYKPRTPHPKSSNWLCSQKTHTVTETQRKRATDRKRKTERESERKREIWGGEERGAVMWLPMSVKKMCTSSQNVPHSI